MINELETFTGPNSLPSQIFNGKLYCLYPYDPRYFQRGSHKRLHVDVWTFHNGKKPPKGYHVHHRDENKHNNSPDNLELKKAGDHMREHTLKRISEDPEWFQTLAKKGQVGAAKWSKTEEGLEFRRKHAKDVLAPYHEHLFKKEAHKHCDVCGKEYITTNLSSVNARFCSNNCKSAWRRKLKVDDIKSNCVVCGNEFTKNKYSKINTCSRSCGSIKGHNPKKYR